MLLCYPTGTPSVAVSLHDETGAEVDAGWVADLQSGLQGDRFNYAGERLMRPFLLSPAMQAPADTGTPRSSPGYLSTEGAADKMLVLHVDCERVRLVSAFCMPAPVASV